MKRRTARGASQAGFTLTELMVALTIGLLVLLALVTLMVNLSRSNIEMSRTNSQIENGRFALQVLQADLVHAGFWGDYVPQFDDLLASTAAAPNDVPTAIPDPCLAYNATNWNDAYKINLIGIPVQAHNAIPAGCSALLTNQKPNTDVLVVRHAEPCVPGAANCAADTAGELYFQSALCAAEAAGMAQGGSANTITLDAAASAADNAYVGMRISVVKGGATEYRDITAYDGATKVATVSPAWNTTSPPTAATTYSIGYTLATGSYTLRNRDCASIAAKRRFVSSIYYIRDFAVTPGDGIPTLVRSQFGLASGTPAHQPAVALIDGIENFKVEFGIDNAIGRCSPAASVNYAQAIARVDPAGCTTNADPLRNTLPNNRGDGIPDEFRRCATATCTATDLGNTVAVKLYVLARSREATPGYTDNKTYALGSATLPAFNDHFKRHVFSTTVRLNNISGRRETP